ncbi:MAG: hypothetical protein PUB22_03470, partial [Clostridiales bacterium]|nr:hypothetical protein [Clostridiales bacterium]
MKKTCKRVISSVLAGVMALSMCTNAFAMPVKTDIYDNIVNAVEEAKVPVLDGSLDDMEAPELDNSVPNQLPMTGYYSKTITVGETNRTAKVYLSEGIHVRDYYTIIAVPDGVNTEEFLTEGGWYAMADAKNEGLFILEPGEGGWGTAEEEADYVNAAISFYSGNKYFSIFGENYLVGYGKGSSALEYWAAANPLKVIGQVYVDSEGVDTEYLKEVGAKEFATKANGYNQVTFPEDFELLTNSDAVVPTWFVGGAPESASYWLEVNDCTTEVKEDADWGVVYEQAEDSDNWTTDYSGPISAVAVQEEKQENSKSLTADICNFLYYYTRYENAFVYGNQLSVRADFSDMEIKTLEVNGHDREYMVYEPDGMMENSPVMFIWPGNTQTDRVFFDATQWKEVADAEGFMLVMICEDYNTSTTVTHKDSAEFQEKLIAAMKEDYAGKIDPERFYGTGQSLGSMTTQGFVSTNPDFYAAVASTSGPMIEAIGGASVEDRTYKSIPTYLIYGQGDLGMLEGTLWDDIDNSLDDWAEYVLEANGLDFEAVGAEDYTVKALDAFGHKNLHTWTWNKDVEGVSVPLVQLSENMVRAHNCISAEMPELWDYAKHFKATYDKNGNVTARYYSESAFAEDDAVLICEEEPVVEEIPSLDDMETPALDNSVPNRLPMTGYYQKSIAVGEETRTAKVYLAEGIHIRDYYTIIAVPDGVNTEEFLTEGGWFEKADANHEGLFILEPGKDGWGTAEEEAAYVNAAISFYSGNGYFSIFGENYLVGYGKGGTALEYWAAANPLKVIGQVYVGSEGLDSEYLTATGETVFPTKANGYNQVTFPEGFELLTYSDAVVPTWYVGGTSEDSLNYWLTVNDCVETAQADDAFGAVYAQAADSDNWTTDYSGPISKVAVQAEAKENSKALTEDICSFLYYYTRYENAFIYGNQLSVRADLSGMEVKTLEVNGHDREYMVYEPEGMMENTPVMFVWPGNTQTDRVFFDATQWKEVADAEKFMLVMICEDYNTSTTVTHKDSAEFQEKLSEAIKTDYAGKVDPERFYGTGQSLGSMTTQGFVATNPDFYAAVASTSGPIRGTS